jgi:hypothetical protein
MRPAVVHVPTEEKRGRNESLDSNASHRSNASQSSNSSHRSSGVALMGFAVAEHKDEVVIHGRPQDDQDAGRDSCCVRIHVAARGLARVIKRGACAPFRAFWWAPRVMGAGAARDFVATGGTSLLCSWAMGKAMESMPEVPHPWNALAGGGSFVILAGVAGWTGGTALSRACNGGRNRSRWICGNLVNSIAIPIGASLLTLEEDSTPEEIVRKSIIYLVGATIPRMTAQVGRDTFNFGVGGAMPSLEPQYQGAGLVMDSPIYTAFHHSRLGNAMLGYTLIIALHQLFLRDEITNWLIRLGMPPALAALAGPAISAGIAEALDAVNGVIGNYYAGDAHGVDIKVKPRKGCAAYNDPLKYIRAHGTMRTLYFPSVDVFIAASKLYERWTDAWLGCRMAAMVPHIISETRAHYANRSIASLTAEELEAARSGRLGPVLEQLAPLLGVMTGHRSEFERDAKDILAVIKDGPSLAALDSAQACSKVTFKAVLTALEEASKGNVPAEKVVKHVIERFDALLQIEVKGSGNVKLGALAEDALADLKKIPPQIHEQAILEVVRAILEAFNDKVTSDRPAAIQAAMEKAGHEAAETGIWLKRNAAYDTSLNMSYTVLDRSSIDEANERYVMGQGCVPLPDMLPDRGDDASAGVAPAGDQQRPSEGKNEELKTPRGADKPVAVDIAAPRSAPFEAPLTSYPSFLPLSASSSSSPSSSSGPGVDGPVVLTFSKRPIPPERRPPSRDELFTLGSSSSSSSSSSLPTASVVFHDALPATRNDADADSDSDGEVLPPPEQIPWDLLSRADRLKGLGNLTPKRPPPLKPAVGQLKGGSRQTP